MVGHGGCSAGSYLADPTSPIPSHCASIVVTSTVRVNTSAKHTMWSRNSCSQVSNKVHKEESIAEVCNCHHRDGPLRVRVIQRVVHRCKHSMIWVHDCHAEGHDVDEEFPQREESRVGWNGDTAQLVTQLVEELPNSLKYKENPWNNKLWELFVDYCL